MNVKYTCAPYENLSDTTNFKEALFNNDKLIKLALDDVGKDAALGNAGLIKQLLQEIAKLQADIANPKTTRSNRKAFKKKLNKARIRLIQKREFYPNAFIAAMRSKRQIYKFIQENTTLIPGISGPDEKIISVSQITNPIPCSMVTGKDKTII